jgi:hypothetical protein
LKHEGLEKSKQLLRLMTMTATGTKNAFDNRALAEAPGEIH